MKILQETVLRKPAESLSCRVFDQPVFDCPYHQHKELEILQIEESAGRVLVGDFAGQFRPGHIYVFGSQLPHAFINLPGTERATSLCIQFDPSLVSPFAATLPEFNLLDALLERFRRGWFLQGPLAETASASITRIFASAGPSRVLELFRLFLSLADSSHYRELASEGYTPQKPGLRASRLEKTLTFIHANSAAELSLPELARRAAMSESALHRLFRQRIGCTPGAYIINLRLANAVRGLIESDDSIAHIAFASGFSSLSNFNRRFQKRFRRSPREYRKSMSNGRGT